jgi:hypothetical protein
LNPDTQDDLERIIRMGYERFYAKITQKLKIPVSFEIDNNDIIMTF